MLCWNTTVQSEGATLTVFVALGKFPATKTISYMPFKMHSLFYFCLSLFLYACTSK